MSRRCHSAVYHSRSVEMLAYIKKPSNELSCQRGLDALSKSAAALTAPLARNFLKELISCTRTLESDSCYRVKNTPMGSTGAYALEIKVQQKRLLEIKLSKLPHQSFYYSSWKESSMRRCILKSLLKSPASAIQMAGICTRSLC